MRGKIYSIIQVGYRSIYKGISTRRGGYDSKGHSLRGKGARSYIFVCVDYGGAEYPKSV